MENMRLSGKTCYVNLRDSWENLVETGRNWEFLDNLCIKIIDFPFNAVKCIYMCELSQITISGKIWEFEREDFTKWKNLPEASGS